MTIHITSSRARTRRSDRRAARRLLVAGSTLGVVAGAAAWGVGPALGADPAAPVADCAAPYDVTQLQRDDAVTGLTVVQGTTPESFTGTVIGTLKDGIAPGIDMIMIKLDSPALEEAGGVWAGMSGSPVYIGDQLVGAVAYGLSYGPSPIAGITPFSAMDDYLSAARPSHVAVSDATARRIAASSDATRAQAAQGFSPLPEPMSVSGLSSHRVDQLSNVKSAWAKGHQYAVGRAGSSAADASSIIAGGNLAASVSYGDVSMAAVGTATSVCDGRVVGFGHPFNFAGATTEGLHPAEALYVQPDSLGAPFKVANIGAPVGTIDQDRTTGVSGSFGAAPHATTVTSTVAAEGRERTGSTDVYVQQATADTVFGELLANHDRVLDGAHGGTESQTWTISGTENGTPFTLTGSDLFTDRADITFATVFDLADLSYAISQIDGVTLEAVTIDSQVSDSTARQKVVGLEQKRGGTWHPVSQREPVTGRAGQTLQLRAVLSGETPTYAPFSVQVPTGGVKGGFIGLNGGDTVFLNTSGIDSIAKAQEVLAKSVRNDAVGVDARFYGSKLSTRRVQTSSAPLGVVTGGSKGYPFEIR